MIQLRQLRSWIFTFSIAILFSGCGERKGFRPLSEQPGAVESLKVTLVIAQRASSPEFRPRMVSIVAPGTVVRWENADSQDHSITSPIGLWDSGRVRPGQYFERVFREEGAFHFTSVFDRELEGTIHVRSN